MFIPLAKLGPACGIAVLFIMGFLFISQSLLLPSKNIWEDVFKLIHNDRELEFQTSGDFNWWTGLNWNMTIKAKLPCTHGEEMIEELSRADEEKTFKLLDQIHSAILLREREQIIGSQHALGHLLRFENSVVFFSEEIDFKKLKENTSIEGEGTNTLVANGPVTYPAPQRRMIKLKVSQGKLKAQEMHEAESFKLFRRVDKSNNTTVLTKEIEGSVDHDNEHDEGEMLYWLFNSDTARAQVNVSQIDFIKLQLKSGVFMSLKVIGSESENGLYYTVKELNGRSENCTYKFSSNLHIDSQPVDPTKGKPMVIRIPRDHVGNEKLNYHWYNLIPFFRLLFSSLLPPRKVNFCLTYERGIKADSGILIPKTIVSFLICY